MKKILYLLMTTVLCFTFTNCSDDDWSDGDPAMEHIYYVGFEKWFTKTANDISYSVKEQITIPISIQYYSERLRSYDVATYYYVSSEGLSLGSDYQVVDDKGAVVQPDSKGAFRLEWPQSKKGVQVVYVKTINAKHIYDESKLDFTGMTEKEKQDAIAKEKERIRQLNSFKVLTFDPGAGAISHPDNIVNSKTNDYEVRSFTQNYFQTVFISK
ncbi:MAG: hypothetical protein LBV71_07685 [Prevotella sp.]|jgi:hypothetical protein|nr:hypothetical protein [Prevotella sp.]